MTHPSQTLARRSFLSRSAGFTAALVAVPGLFAEQLSRTPEQTEGPFYPDHLPLDTDNDLIVLNDSLTPAVGEITHFSGRIVTPSGEPVRNATIEIWQCDAKGSYLHSRGANPRTDGARDSHFQGFGRFLTASTGEYYFRTIKPVPYPGRTPHIHVIVRKGDRRLLTTQCYIKGHPQNETDGVLRRSLPDPADRTPLLVDWVPVPNRPHPEFTARFDIVLGSTPADA